MYNFYGSLQKREKTVDNDNIIKVNHRDKVKENQIVLFKTKSLPPCFKLYQL